MSWAEGPATSTATPPAAARTRRQRARVRVEVDGVFSAAATPISRILSPPPPFRASEGNDHSSCPAITGRIQRPTRRLRTGRPQAPPYLVLLRAGFCLPPTLRPARCALTAPFHPYLSTHPYGVRSRQASLACPERAPKGRVEGRYVFCATSPSGYPARALPGALPYGVRTFLSRQHFTRRATRATRLPATAVVWPGCGPHSIVDC